MDADLICLVTPDQIKAFDGTASKRRGEGLLAMCECVLVCDFDLLTKIVPANANDRSGVLSNVTVEQFRKSSHLKDQYVVTIADHKTARTHGPAKIFLDETLFGCLTTFVEDIRSRRAHADGYGGVFLSWTRDAISRGRVSNGIQSIWKKAGLRGDITCTLVRKTAVSRVHNERPDMRNSLAVMMQHRVETATKSNRVFDKEPTSVAAAKVLSTLMRPPGERSKTADSSSSSRPRSATSTDSTVRMEPTGGQSKRSEEQVDTLRSVFETEIQNGGAVTVDSLRSKLNRENCSCLSDLSERQIYDKIRSLTTCQDVRKDAGDAVPLLELPPEKLSMSA